ncbi:EamA family transporter RarD [Novispirillum itersonii]|uniref:Chloramphenicol-sensitive protein RarD n=1 Tax=Novispirillum itersonii TaxID=189 RepID=A0A7W9ZG07_NOVIT|nr:EamA family transporter RarD [Novispirillum itersonii]MBB6209937.1 chloramphenicol-sensitive protein RarD [Novispirillum itersonii]
MSSAHSPSQRTGLLAALGAYCLWGGSGLFFRSLAALPPDEIISHRILWSVLAMLPFMLRGNRPAQVLEILRTPRRLVVFTSSAVMVSVNWLIFVYAINSHQALYGSLGYYVFPLVTLALGAVFLKERFSRQQGLAVLLVCAGVGVMIAGLGKLPWITLSLALTFGIYGLIRKMAPADSLTGLFVETLLLTPFAIGWLLWKESLGAGFFSGLLLPGADWHLLALLAIGCPLWTALPLYLFGVGARTLRLSTLGLMQYMSPTVQLAVAVLVFREPFTTAHAITFGLIWAGVVVYSLPLLRRKTPGTETA